jgi:hypothetical protein
MFRSPRSVVARIAGFLTAALLFPLPTMVTHAPVGAATLPTVSVNDVSITEGTGSTKTLTFTITQSARGKSRVSFTTARDTAKAPADFLVKTGSVRFAGHKLTKAVSVTIVGDALDEPDETFFLELTGATGATIDDGEGIGTIQDDDLPPVVQVPSTLSVPEGQDGDITVATIDVTLSAPSGQQVTADWMTADGTGAVAGSDYESGSGTLQFAPGETDKSILISVIGDLADEADETFTTTISSPQNANLGNATETVTIVDNDPFPTGVPVFDVDDVQTREGASGTSNLSFTVARSDDTVNAVTVDYAVSNGTAFTPSDYTVVPVTGTLSFAASQTNMTVDVAVLGDRLLEHNETLYLTLTNPSSGAIDDGQGTGTIVNDDTKTTAVVKVRAAKHAVVVRGLVSPSRPGKHAIVRLYRRSSGAWVRIASGRPLLRGKTDTNGDGFTDSRYKSTLKRAKRGRCRIVASYPGGTKFSGSKTTKLFRC